MASMQEQAFFCIAEGKLQPHNRLVYCVVCLVSAGLGLSGATWQAIQWKPLISGFTHRRKPSPNPIIVFCLALADLLACMGVVARSVAMLMTSPPQYDPVSNSFIPLHGDLPLVAGLYFLEILSQYFYGVTFLWTIAYALDIYLQLSSEKAPTFWYHVICWFLPVFTTLAGRLPSITNTSTLLRCASDGDLIWIYCCNNVLILMVMLANPVLYLLSTKLIGKRMRESGLLNSHNRAIMSALARKYLAVILIFTVCWLPNLVDAGIEIEYALHPSRPSTMARFFPLWLLQAILNPLQGLFNCFVYGRHLLFQRIARTEARITTCSDDMGESTPILYRKRHDSEVL